MPHKINPCKEWWIWVAIILRALIDSLKILSKSFKNYSSLDLKALKRTPPICLLQLETRVLMLWVAPTTTTKLLLIKNINSTRIVILTTTKLLSIQLNKSKKLSTTIKRWSKMRRIIECLLNISIITPTKRVLIPMIVLITISSSRNRWMREATTKCKAWISITRNNSNNNL